MEKYLGGAFSSKLIQLRLNSIYIVNFDTIMGVQRPFEGVLNTSGGVPKIYGAPPPQRIRACSNLVSSSRVI